MGVAVTRLNPGKVRVYEAEDICVPIKHVPFMLKKIQEIGRKHGLPLVTYGHIGDGNLHTGIAIDPRNEEEWKRGPRGEGRHLRRGPQPGRHAAR